MVGGTIPLQQVQNRFKGNTAELRVALTLQKVVKATPGLPTAISKLWRSSASQRLILSSPTKGNAISHPEIYSRNEGCADFENSRQGSAREPPSDL